MSEEDEIKQAIAESEALLKKQNNMQIEEQQKLARAFNESKETAVPTAGGPTPSLDDILGNVFGQKSNPVSTPAGKTPLSGTDAVIAKATALQSYIMGGFTGVTEDGRTLNSTEMEARVNSMKRFNKNVTIELD